MADVSAVVAQQRHSCEHSHQQQVAKSTRTTTRLQRAAKCLAVATAADCSAITSAAASVCPLSFPLPAQHAARLYRPVLSAARRPAGFRRCAPSLNVHAARSKGAAESRRLGRLSAAPERFPPAPSPATQLLLPAVTFFRTGKKKWRSSGGLSPDLVKMRDSGIQESGACEDFSRLVGLRRGVARNPRLNCRAIGPEHSRAFTPLPPNTCSSARTTVLYGLVHRHKGKTPRDLLIVSRCSTRRRRMS
jgi:hypothetical protein